MTAEALAPFRTAAFARPDGDPAPLPHLDDAGDRAKGGLDITLEAYISTETMRRTGTAPQRVTQTSCALLYWTVAQMIAHHTSNGCNICDRRSDRVGHRLGPGEIELGQLARTHRARLASRSRCRAARSAASSKTATKSSSAAFAQSPAMPASASANAAPWCCRPGDSPLPAARGEETVFHRVYADR